MKKRILIVCLAFVPIMADQKTYIDPDLPEGEEAPYWILDMDESEAGRSVRSMAKSGDLIDYWRRNRAD